ncbi:M48 family metallopeptidase [Sulfurifustis variabilis]|nr:M48 family metallopeptidase [Sulfurifustis variabilis]
MTLTRRRLAAVLAGMLVLLFACQTTPTGRRQLNLFPDEQVAEMGQTAFAQMKQKTPPAQGDPASKYIQCVAQSVVQVVRKPKGGGQWDVSVFADDQVNAFALPGGGIGIYTGILKAARTPDQLAAVIGHEIAHVQAEHANARLSTQYATEAGLGLIQAIAGGGGGEGGNVMALLGLGAQVGILLPFSRAQESEADIIGLEYMARAGYDPRQAVNLWQNMARVGGSGPPAFLSTHPSSEQRMENLNKHTPKALELYRQAQAQGRKPNCTPPR